MFNKNEDVVWILNIFHFKSVAEHACVESKIHCENANVQYVTLA